MMKKVWKRALACMLVLALVAGYFPTRMNQVVNAEDSNAQQETALEFGKTDTYLQLSNPLSAAPQAIEATVKMPEIQRSWTLCTVDDILVRNSTASEVKTVDNTVTAGPTEGSSYRSITMPSDKEFMFEHKFNDVQVPYTWTNEDVALAFWMYSDKAVTLSQGNIELTSSGTCDHNEIDWAFVTSNHNVALEAGWNYVELPLKDMRHNTSTNEGSEFDLQELNYFRWHSLKFAEETNIGLTDVKLVVTAAGDAQKGTLLVTSDKMSKGDGKATYTKGTDQVTENGVASDISYYEIEAYNNSGTNYRVYFDMRDQSNFTNRVENVPLTKSDLSKYSLEFWIRSSTGNDINLTNQTFKLMGGTTDTDYTTNNYLQLKGTTIKFDGENTWTKVSLPLSAAANVNKLADTFTGFQWVRFLYNGVDSTEKIAISDMRLVQYPQLLVSSDNMSIGDGKATYTKGTAQVTENGVASDISYYEIEAFNNSGTNYRVYFDMWGQQDFTTHVEDVPLTKSDLSKYSLEFWIRSSTGKDINLSNQTFKLMGGNTVDDYNNNYLQLKGTTIQFDGENTWTKVSLPLSASANVNKLADGFTGFQWVRFVCNVADSSEKIALSDMKLVDLTASVTTSDTPDASYYTILANATFKFIVTKHGKLAVILNDKQYTLDKNICIGQDVKVKAVLDNGYVKFYVNDVLVGMGVYDGTAAVGTTGYSIGGEATGNVMNGTISKLNIYSDATIHTCIGEWALIGDIQEVAETIADTSGQNNTAIFRGSRADDWSDYQIPTEIVDNQTIISGDDKTDLRAGSGNTFSITTEKSEVKIGTGACKIEGKEANANILIGQLTNGVDISRQQEGGIHFWLYVQEETTFGETLSIEIGSANTFDKNEYQWVMQSSDVVVGQWNPVYLEFAKASDTGGKPNMEAINWVRFYSSEKLNGTVIIDDIKAVMPEQSWSLVYIPDIENLTSNDASNDTYNATWKAMAQWIANNAETENIQHVIGGGDTTKNNSNEEYTRAMEGYQLFKDKVSWSAMIGYNDYAGNYGDREASNYQTTFSDTVIKASAAGETYIGSYEDTEKKSTTENSYYRFSVNGVKWMILQLEYAPRTEVLDWADEIAKAYPLDNIILTTPEYLNGYGAKLKIGETVWNALSENQNIKMILCGHSTNGTGAIAQATETYSNGNGAVPVLMMNAQDLDADDDAYYTDRPLGMISILRFSADGKNVAVQYYSPTEGKSFSPDDNFGNANSNSITFEIDTEVCTPIITPYGEEYNTTFKAATAPNEADIPTGYIFAGWFTDDACTIALKKSDNVATAYAKFVDAEVLSVKAQSKLDKETNLLPAGETDVRFVTTVDSTKYRKVGFKITVPEDSVAEGKDNVVEVGSQKVYEYLYAVGMAGAESAERLSYTPSGEFSPQSTLFKTYTVKGIPKEKHRVKFTVQAYWITQDGTTVYGAEVSKAAIDGEP